MSAATPKVLDIIRTAADDCRVQGNTLASNELLEAAGMTRELLEAARPLVAMTFNEGFQAERRGKRLLFCQHDNLNPCWSGSWSEEHGPGKHWGGGDACPECNLRAAIAKATGSAA